jgi:excisionase family DNA binding protein
MAEESPLTVSDAAEILGVDERAVRFLVSSGQLRGIKRGSSWWLDRRSVEQRLRQDPGRGRPLSPAMAWTILLLASGEAQALPRLAAHQPSRARHWLATHSLLDEATRFRARARREAFDVHPSELQRVAARDDVIRTGISAADVVGVHGGPRELELYAPKHTRDAIIAEHAVEPGEGPLLLRWVPDEIWPVLHGDVAPRAAVLVDLLEHDDPRVRRQAAEALERP